MITGTVPVVRRLKLDLFGCIQRYLPQSQDIGRYSPASCGQGGAGRRASCSSPLDSREHGGSVLMVFQAPFAAGDLRHTRHLRPPILPQGRDKD